MGGEHRKRRTLLKPLVLATALLLALVGFFAQPQPSSAKTARHVSQCQASVIGYPPSLGAQTEIDDSPVTQNESDYYANRDYDAIAYGGSNGILLLRESHPAGVHLNYSWGANYYLQMGIYNRTYGAATGWYLWAWVGC